MPQPPKPSVQTLDEFQNTTGPVRGSLQFIDYVLKAFHDDEPTANHQRNVAGLEQILVYIRAYKDQKNRDRKPGEKPSTREYGVQALEREVFTRLQWESFMMKKAGGARPTAKALDGPYDLERQDFQGRKQRQAPDTNPYSVSTGKISLGKGVDWSTMTLPQFTQMMSSASAFKADPIVYFVRLAERIDKYLLVCVDGRWYQNAKLVDGFFMYVLDRYGNLLVGPISETGNYGDGSSRQLIKGVRYNHSSLAAGREAICAGEMDFKNGKITEISNSSGHYSPDMKRLHAAVTCLVDEYRVDLKGCLIKVFTDGSGNSKKVPNGEDFYKNINCPKA